MSTPSRLTALWPPPRHDTKTTTIIRFPNQQIPPHTMHSQFSFPTGQTLNPFPRTPTHPDKPSASSRPPHKLSYCT